MDWGRGAYALSTTAEIEWEVKRGIKVLYRSKLSALWQPCREPKCG